MKKKLGALAVTVIAGIACLLIGRQQNIKQKICINEVRCWENSAKRDGYYGSDYIELYNSSRSAVDLTGWYLSDDEEQLKKSQIEGVVIEAGSWVLLYANGESDTGDALNFKLSAEGEKIFLSDPQGNLIDSVYVPKQEFGTVYARKTDGADQWCVQEETVNDSNNGAKMFPEKSLSEPVFSHESGFYEEAFVLTLEADPGERIYYTLDGSKPTEESLVYTDGILIENVSAQPNVCSAVKTVVQEWLEYEPSEDPVDKAVIVRAMAMTPEHDQVSEVVTHTYFVDEAEYQEKNVVSVTADFEDLFGKNGIFVTGEEYDAYYLSDGELEWTAPNFLKSGRRWEVSGNMEILQNGLEILNQGVGIRTQGASTRLASKKKMSIYSRKEYSGNPYFEGFTLGEQSVHSIYTNHSISNIVFPELLKDRAVSVQHPEKCVVFLNGEYWYDTYLLEKYSKYYLKDIYGVDKDNVIIIKGHEATEGPADAYDYYSDIRGFASINDLSDPENYNRFKEKADVQSYIDYICANVYLCNMDMSETKNEMLWRTVENENTEYGDLRWRWMIYDMDCVEWLDCSYYEVEEKAAINSFSQVMQYTEMSMKDQSIYASCKNNPEFVKQFVLSFMDMANVNFSLENVKDAFEVWDTTLEGSMLTFFEHRFDYIVPYMAEEFGLTGTLEEVTLKVNDPSGGTIHLNTTTPDLSDGSWTGRYYTDYPVTVTAVPEEDYRFVGWRGSINSEENSLEAEVTAGGITLEAVFEKNGNESIN